MKRYILTGTPGSGKTSILRALAAMGFSVVEEAATDVIAREQMMGDAEPWTRPAFIDKIVRLQRERQMLASGERSQVQFHDRSPFCTYALSAHLGYPISSTLAAEIERVETKRIYQRRVFFIANLGFCTPTAARRISFEKSLRFETLHEDVYRSFGYECVMIAARDVADRAQEVRRYAGASGRR